MPRQGGRPREGRHHGGLNIANELLETQDEQRAGEQSLSELNQRLEKALSDAPGR